ncbi:MAG: putative S-layer protein [Candidatus Pacearchaeota archaeon]
MKAKNKEIFICMFLFSFVLFASLVSSSSIEVSGDLQKTTLPGTTISGKINFTNNNLSINFSEVRLISENQSLSFSPVSFSLNSEERREVSYNIIIPPYLSPRIYTYYFLINASNGSVNEITRHSISVQVNSTSGLEISGNLKISDFLNKTTISVKNTGNSPLTNVFVVVENSSLFSFKTITSPQDINAGETKNFEVEIIKTDSSTRLGSFSHNIIAKSEEGINTTSQLVIEKSYCKYGENRTSNIRIIDLEDKSEGDEWEWAPLKKVNLRVEVENRDNVRKSISVKVGVYNLDKEKFILLDSDKKELEITQRINDNDEEYYDFEFTLPVDMKENEKYRLYVKAYEKGKEDTQCIASSSSFSDTYFQEISVSYEDSVLVENAEVPSFLSCGSSGAISVKVYNLDLGDEEKMRLNLYSRDLGINVYSEQFELDEGDSKLVTLFFSVPEGKEGKMYPLNLYVEYDYRESTDSYRKSDLLGTYKIMVEGDKCSAPEILPPLISATLSSDTKTEVGENLTIEINVLNRLNSTQNFTLSLEGYDSWASLVYIDPTSFSIRSGESKNIKVILKPTKEGEQNFAIKLVYGANSIEQKATIKVSKKEEEKKMSIVDKIKGDLNYYLTIGIFVLLILVILVIVLKYSKNR